MPPTYVNGHISATGDLIHFMFDCRVGFSGTADRTALFTIRSNPRWRPPPCWKNFKWRYLHNRSSDPLHVWLWVGFSGTADLMAPFSIRTNSRWRPPPYNFESHISAMAHDLLRASRGHLCDSTAFLFVRRNQRCRLITIVAVHTCVFSSTKIAQHNVFVYRVL